MILTREFQLLFIPIHIKRGQQEEDMDEKKYFYLLQVNDALFPIGGYSHSYGLETYIQKGIVRDTKTAGEFIDKRIRYSLLYNEILFVRLAFESACEKNVDRLRELEELFLALKAPREVREAGKKLGSRFVKTVQAAKPPYVLHIFKKYCTEGRGRSCHTIAYGVFCADLGLSLEETLKHYLYSQVSAIVTNCVKAIPLSQTDGQRLLAGQYPLLCEVLERVKQLPEECLGSGMPGFDIRCMQHEGLYSRIYMS